MPVVFSSQRRVWRVRALLWISLVGAIATAWAGWGLFETYGLAPADGGVLKPFGSRLLLGGFVTLLGVGLAAAMLIYSGLYVVELREDGESVIIESLSLLGSKRFEGLSRDVLSGVYHHGRKNVSSRGIRVNAPWITLRVRGRRWPFVIDLQAEVIDAAGLAKLAPAATKAWQRDSRAPRHTS